jgi:hypothetical protein
MLTNTIHALATVLASELAQIHDRHQFAELMSGTMKILAMMSIEMHAKVHEDCGGEDYRSKMI